MSFGALSRILSGGKSGTSTLGDLCPLAWDLSMMGTRRGDGIFEGVLKQFHVYLV